MKNFSPRVLITAGLPYSNGRLHVGHIAGCYLPADIYTRYLRMNGVDVRYVCGSDDHGVAIQLAAEKAGKTPAELAAFYYEKQKEDFAGLNIQFDAYGSTSQTSFHKKTSQDFFLNLHEKGYFKKKSSEQFYDEDEQKFLPDRFVKGTCGYCGTPEQNGDQCENCGKLLDVEHLKDAKSTLTGKPAVVKETVHWFLDLTQFEESVQKWLDSADVREQTRSYVNSLISSGLVQRGMTRDLDWGIPVPLDDPDAQGKVLYVWFDAPIGYISNTLQMCEEASLPPTDYEKWWKSPDCDIVHFIGEDNTIFHCIIWIAMLSAEGSFQLPKSVVVNQFLNIQFPDQDVEKISKSRGSAVWVHEYLSQGGNTDALRYYLTAIAPEKARTVYQPDDLIQKNNTDLANVLGNFVNRITSFSLKYVGETFPTYADEKVTDIDRDFKKKMHQAFESVSEALNKKSTKSAIHFLMDFTRDCNKYVDDKKPWVTRKEDMETTQVTLAYGLEAIFFLGVLFHPFLPETSSKILEIFEVSPESLHWDQAIAPPPLKVIRKPEILFSKIDAE